MLLQIKQNMYSLKIKSKKKKIKSISTKGLENDLVNGYKIFNGSKYFSSAIFQNYLVFIPVKSTLNI